MPKIGDKFPKQIESIPPARNVGVPFWSTTDGETARIYKGDVLEVLRTLPSKSVQTTITSPPYWALRSYLDSKHEDKHQELGSEKVCDCLGWARGENCAERDWKTACHVCRMVLVFRELRRVLRDDGVLFLNYGDTYATGSVGKAGGGVFENGRTDGRSGDGGRQTTSDGHQHSTKLSRGLPQGNLYGVPWRVAMALQADGWILRQDIIWQKKSPMPESVTNRCTKSHEHIFLLTKKGSGYYYDAVAIREQGVVGFDNSGVRGSGNKARKDATERGCPASGVDGSVPWEGTNRNKRDVWQTDGENALLLFLQENRPEVVAEYMLASGNKQDVFSVASQSYSGAHYAVFGENLITPCILAGSSGGGACPDCGAPYNRVTEETKLVRERSNDFVKYAEERGVKSGLNADRNDGGRSNVGGSTSRATGLTGGSYAPPGQSPHSNARGNVNSCANTVAGVDVRTVGWQPSCSCHGMSVDAPAKRLKSLREAKGVVDDQFQVDAAVRAISGKEWADWQSGEHGAEDYADATVEEHAVVDSLLGSGGESHTVPCVILDPFLGSGTSISCAIKHGRRGWGIELSEKYIVENAIPRITSRLVDLGLVHLIKSTRRPLGI